MWHRMFLVYCLVWVGVAQAQPPLPTYTVIPLDNTAMHAVVARDGDRVVAARPGAPGQPFQVWQIYPTLAFLGTLDAALTATPYGATETRVVGGADTSHGIFGDQAFRIEGGTVTPLGALCATCSSTATGLNVAGAISGSGTDSAGLLQPLSWPTGSAPPVPLPLPAGTLSGFANALSSGGDSTGGRNTASGTLVCTYWPREGGVEDCPPVGATQSFGLDINGSRTIVGSTFSPATGRTGFRKAPGLDAVLLPRLPGDTIALSMAINDAGVIVGTSQLPDPNAARLLHQAGVRWDNDLPTDLNTLIPADTGGSVVAAHGISDTGAILATCLFPAGYQECLLIPTAPESKKPKKAHHHRWQWHWARGKWWWD